MSRFTGEYAGVLQELYDLQKSHKQKVQPKRVVLKDVAGRIHSLVKALPAKKVTPDSLLAKAKTMYQQGRLNPYQMDLLCNRLNRLKRGAV